MKTRQRTDRNRTTYESPAVIDHFEGLHTLQPPERAVLDRFSADWHRWRLLDLGVGGGRTTTFFGPAVKQYIGVDYARGMVERCAHRFGTAQGRMCFLQADARTLAPFGDDSFDFVLFSFNGIDYVSHADRQRVFSAVRRVLAPSGYFMFSTHNLNFDVRQLFFPVKIHRNPIETLRRIRNGSRFRMTNREYRYPTSADYAIINDGALDFGLATCYVNPASQIAELESAGFTDVEALSVTDGARLAPAALDANREPWLYYLARAVT